MPSESNSEPPARRLAPYLVLAALTFAVYLFPYVFTRVPPGYLYLDTDVPLHAAGVQKVLCRECFAKDVFFVGDIRPISERFFFYPLMAAIAKSLHVDPVAVSGFAGVFIAMITVWAVYWTLRRLTGKRWFSAAFSMVFLFGVQIFGGVWIGGLPGGFNTHNLAISLAALLFGSFIIRVIEDRPPERLLELFYVSALLMNLYPLVFPHLLLLMATYLAAYARIGLKRVLKTLAVCALLVPIPIIDFLRVLHRPGALSSQDFRQVMPYMFLENWPYFLATGRRFLVIGLAVAALSAIHRRLRPSLADRTKFSLTALQRLAFLSMLFTVGSILIEQFSPLALRFQLSPAMSQWLFLSLLYLAVLLLLALPLSPLRKNAMAVLLLAFLTVAASNVFFTARRYREWIKLSPGRRDRVTMLRFIKTLPPKDALFVAPTLGLAIETRGFAGRGVLISEKDLGASQLDTQRLEKVTALLHRLKNLKFDTQLDEVRAIAREEGADYVIVPLPPFASRDRIEVLFQNDRFAVIKP